MYRITHPKVERAINMYNQGKIDAVSLCAIIKMCHPYKYRYVIGWACESVAPEDFFSLIEVTDEEMDNRIFIWNLQKYGILMLPALKNKKTGKILAWDEAMSHDSIYFNFMINGTSKYAGDDETGLLYQHGFITSSGKFLDRKNAGKFAYLTKQWFVKDKPLYSGDAQQFSFRDIEEGDVEDYYKSLGISIPKGLIKVHKSVISLLIEGYEASITRLDVENEEWGDAICYGVIKTTERIEHLKDLL